MFAVVGALRVFATIFVWTFTLYCVKYNGANFIIKMCVNLHMNSNIHNEFPAQGANFIIKMCVNLHMNSNIHNEFPAPFANSVTNFFYFDEISKMRLLQLKNDLLIMYTYNIHNKPCIFSPGAPKNQNYDEKFYSHAHIA